MGKKLRRSARLVDMTQHLLEHPYKLIPLTFFAERFGSAKSSISEDLSIIKELFEHKGSGVLRTVAGAAGGVKYIPLVDRETAIETIEELRTALEQSDRLLPGGYIYMSDILGNPEMLNKLGKIMATIFADREIDAVMTVETKGIPLAYATANFLNAPVVIARRDSKVTEGSVVSINYVSGSSKRIQTMSLARRVMPEKSKALIIDDYMKAGGTARGMIDLLKEFNAEVVGLGVLAEAADVEERLVEDYVSLAKIVQLDSKNRDIKVTAGNFISYI